MAYTTTPANNETIANLPGDIRAVTTLVTNHTAATSGAHDASAISYETGTVQAALDTAAGHEANQNNPHGVTAAQAGAVALPAGSVQGDILYYNGTTWVSIPAGLAGQFLRCAGTYPEWSYPEPDPRRVYFNCNSWNAWTGGSGNWQYNGMANWIATGTTCRHSVAFS